jgi:hypothetical protein
MTLKVIQCNEHDHVVVFVNDELVYQHDYCPESAIKVAKHLGWNVVLESISAEEYEQRFA